MSGILYFFLRFVLYACFIIVTSPVAIVWILIIKYLDTHEQFRILEWIGFLFALAYIVCLEWFTSQTAKHVAFGNKDLGAAVKLTYYDLRLRLSFLPLVGHWFESRTDKDDAEPPS